MAAHELGHSLVGLGDEYSYGAPSSATPRNNCTLNADDPPWSAWLDEPGVSAFPVCGYTNQHRPTDSSCMMRSLRDDYCVVCREQAVLAIYGALPRLIGSLSPEAGEVARVPGEALRFSAEVLGESSARFAWAWLLDGERISSEPELVLEGCRGSLLELRLQDPTAWVRSDPDGLLQDAAAWTLLPCPGGNPDDSGDSGPDGTGDPGLTPPIDAEAPAACACSSGGPAGALTLPVLILGLLRRRREPPSLDDSDR